MGTKTTSVCCAVVAVLAFFFFHTPVKAGIIVFAGSSFDSNESTMNSTLGITGYTIENFEDSTLIDGLSISRVGSTGGQNSTSGLYTKAWDGTKTMTAYWNQGNTEVLFNFNATTSFGIGISDEEGNTFGGDFSVSVNGGAFVNLHDDVNYSKVQDDRNAYIRIDQDLGGPMISSVRFKSFARNDGIQFDHLAVSTAVPEPTSAAMFVLASLVGLSRRRRQAG